MIISLEAFFIVVINFDSSFLSTTQAKLSFEIKSYDFLPDFAVTGALSLNVYPFVTLISFLIFSFGLKLTNNLDGFLFNFFGALKTGAD